MNNREYRDAYMNPVSEEKYDLDGGILLRIAYYPGYWRDCPVITASYKGRTCVIKSWARTGAWCRARLYKVLAPEQIEQVDLFLKALDNLKS